jgi:hypothetical protein
MPTPREDTLREIEERRRVLEGEILFQSEQDNTFQENLILEQSGQTAPVHLVQVSTERDPQGPHESAGVDPLYGDILDPQFFESQVTAENLIRAVVEQRPSEQLLMRYGIEEKRDVLFQIPFALLRIKNFVTRRRFRGVDIGDFVVWDSTWYLVDSVHRGTYFGQTNHAYFVAAFTNRYQPNAISPTDSGAC